jgi:predicted amidohydrolase YtcJ
MMTERVMRLMEQYNAEYTSELFKVETFKIHGDGAFDGYTAGTVEPYADRPESHGITSFEADYQREITLAAAKLGYDIHTHTIGDQTVRQTLDAYQAVREAGLNEVRLATGHTSLVHPDDKPRFKELDVIVNTFAAKNAVPDETILSRLGPERVYGYQPMRSFVDMGVRVVMSADAPAAPLNPFLQMSIALTRRNPGEEEILPPESECLTLEQAIRAYTIDSAYMLRWEDIIGSLEVGKRADLIVLDRNPFEIMPDEIAETNVLATMMNGAVVHEEAIDWSPPLELDGVHLVP